MNFVVLYIFLGIIVFLLINLVIQIGCLRLEFGHSLDDLCMETSRIKLESFVVKKMFSKGGKKNG